jgi:hypothetical protein
MLGDAVVEPVSAAGPAQENPVTLDGELAVNIRVLPAHMGPLLDALTRVGLPLTVTGKRAKQVGPVM